MIISSIFNWDSNPIIGVDKLLGDILITLFCLCIIYAIGIAQTAGFQKKGFAKGIIYGIPFIIIGLCAAFIGNISIDISQLEAIPIAGMLLFTINMLFVGINEEICMRSLILNNLILKYGKSKKELFEAILISSTIFGLIHLVNIFFIPPVTVIVQAVNAASAGILFSVIYICSKNIWATITIHALVDWLSLFIGQCFIGGGSVLSIEMSLLQGLIMIVLGSTPPIIAALILLKKKYFF